MAEQKVFDVLTERGYIEQTTHPEEIRDLINNGKITFYIGFDPTADSLHVGHYIQFMVMKHLQSAGHQPIFLAGGGTTMIGDPSGRTDMRRIMTVDEINANAEKVKKQAERFIDFQDDRALMLNNGDWLRELNYVNFLRDIGQYFNVSRMLSAECYKSRMDQGLTFLEINYMILQAYDFLHMYRNNNCVMQLGGSDQWSNIIAGVDLIRKAEQGSAYGMTFKLLTNSEGKKMGKTASGAVWLDADKTSPYEFYQYWRNIEDADVEKCLSLLTFLPMEEVRALSALEGAEINRAKEILAYEVTQHVHGTEAADEAQQAARALFEGGAQAGALPMTEMQADVFAGDGYGLLTLLKDVQLIQSSSEGIRLIEQGGITLNDRAVDNYRYNVTAADFDDNRQLKIRKGKKTYHLIQL